MTADSEHAGDPEATPTPPAPEKLPLSAVKRRYRRPNEPEDADDNLPPARPGRRPPGETGGIASEPAEDVSTEVDALRSRLEALNSRAQTPLAAEGRGAKYHRLERKQAPPAAPRDPAAPADAAPPVALPSPPAVLHVPAGDTTWHPGWLLGTAGILALAFLAFFLGQWSIRLPAREPAPVATPTWSPGDMTLLDQVLATDRAGVIGDALGQATQLNAALGQRAVLSLYAATLQARMGTSNNAEADLIRSLSAYAPPQTIAALQDRLGFLYARRRDFPAASACFAAAAAADPLDPLTFYHWGEALRRNGKLADAADKFREALLRLPPEGPESESLRECASLRLHLTQIEMGEDAALKPQIDQQLRQAVPSVYWLLTALAYDLQHGDEAGAVAAVQRAAVVASPAQFDLLFNDYYLRTLAARTPVTAPYAIDLTPERRARLDASLAYFIDP